jgi:hypothetical protein
VPLVSEESQGTTLTSRVRYRRPGAPHEPCHEKTPASRVARRGQIQSQKRHRAAPQPGLLLGQASLGHLDDSPVGDDPQGVPSAQAVEGDDVHSGLEQTARLVF